LTAIFFFGLWAASVSTRLRRRASSRRRAESRAARQEHDDLVAERDRLARELASQRAAASTASSTLASAQPAYAPAPAGQPAYASRERPAELFPTPTPRPAALDDGPLMHEVEV
jgi:hypothetical protein